MISPGGMLEGKFIFEIFCPAALLRRLAIQQRFVIQQRFIIQQWFNLSQTEC
jgi:hypothetical protein